MLLDQLPSAATSPKMQMTGNATMRKDTSPQPESCLDCLLFVNYDMTWVNRDCATEDCSEAIDDKAAAGSQSGTVYQVGHQQ